MTKKGLRMEIKLMSAPFPDLESEAGTYAAVLNCSRGRASTCVDLYLRKRYRDEFVRIKSELWLDWPRRSQAADATKRQMIYVQQNDNTPQIEQDGEYEVCASLSYTGDGHPDYNIHILTSNKVGDPKDLTTAAAEVKVEARTVPPVFALFLYRRKNLYTTDTDFVVAVNLSRKPFGVDVITAGAAADADLHIFLSLLYLSKVTGGPRHHLDKEKTHKRLARCSLDRVSHVLSSGISVFVILKRGYSERGKERYLVHVVVDATEDSTWQPLKRGIV